MREKHFREQFGTNKNGHHLLTHVILNLYDFISYVSFTINIFKMDFKRCEGE